MSDKVYYNDVNVEHDDATMTAYVFDKAGKPLFSLSGYMIVGWYCYDNLFVNGISRVVRYPAAGKDYWVAGGYNLYSCEAGMLLDADMAWINDTPAWDIAVQARDYKNRYGLLHMNGGLLLPFDYDDIETYEGCRWPYMALQYYKNRVPFWYMAVGLLFPAAIENKCTYNEEHSYYTFNDKMLDCREVIITEQQAGGYWRFVALQYIEDLLILQHDSGFLFDSEPEVWSDGGIVEYEKNGEPGTWHFPEITDGDAKKTLVLQRH